MSGDYNLYDNAFGAVLQNEGDIKKFLDTFFCFLYRRTDFYIVMKTPTDRMGFPPGIAEKLTLSAFNKYAALAAESAARQESHKKEKESSKPNVVADVPNVGHMEEVATSAPLAPTECLSESTICKSPTSVQSNASSLQQPVVKANDRLVNSEQGHVVCDDSNRVQSSDTSHESTGQAVERSVVYDRKSSPVHKEVDENDPELTLQQKRFQDNPDSYNGAVRDNYSWSQSITDVDIRVKVPANIRRSADVSVVISKKHLKVSFKSSPGKFTDVVDGELTWDIKKDDSMWSIVPGEHVLVNLEKVQERWWEAVFTDEPKISVRKIDPSRSITDLDDEAQAKIEELMYNEHQKRMGLPQSHEKINLTVNLLEQLSNTSYPKNLPEKAHDILRQAWDAEGSPFKGQPFDPSKLNITPGSL